MKFLICSIFFGITLFSCQEQPKDLGAFEDYFFQQENGFIQSQEVNGLHYTIQYRPSELMLLNEWKYLDNKSEAALDSLVQSYKGSKYFLLEISTENGENLDFALSNLNPDEYGKMVYSIGERFVLKHGQIELAPSISHFEKGYELGSKIRVLVAFPIKENITNYTLRYDDFIYNNNVLKYKFLESDLTVPEVPFR